MAEKFLMPKLSPTMEEGQISRWVKNEGDAYEANETLAEVDTDKATMEMTALQPGTLLKILKQAGDTAALGEAIAITGNKGEDISALLSEVAANGRAKKDAESSASKQSVPPSSADGSAPAPATTVEKPQEKSATPSAASQGAAPPPQSSGNGRMIVSPIAARMAADNGIDLR